MIRCYDAEVFTPNHQRGGSHVVPVAIAADIELLHDAKEPLAADHDFEHIQRVLGAGRLKQEYVAE